ncbi:MAG: ribose-phosphate pyrophosphokinase-like domain-containing protein, partial [Planctomycetota bacterium]
MSQADRDHIKIFSGRASRALAEAMCRHLELPMGQGHTDIFPDGELLVKIEEDVRGRDCFVVQSTHNPVNAHLMELLIYIDCLKRASAQRITA